MSILFHCEDCDAYFTTGGNISGEILTNTTLPGYVDMGIGGHVKNQPTLDSDYIYYDGQFDSKICPYCYSQKTVRRGDNEKSKALSHSGKVDQFRYTLERVENLCQALPLGYSLPENYWSEHFKVTDQCKDTVLRIVQQAGGTPTVEDFVAHISDFNRNLIIYSRKENKVWFIEDKSSLFHKNLGEIFFAIDYNGDQVSFLQKNAEYTLKSDMLKDSVHWRESVNRAYNTFHNFSIYMELD